MEILKGPGLPQHLKTFISSKIQMQCFLCFGQMNNLQYSPTIMCMNQHTCCLPCFKQFTKNQNYKQVFCPQCLSPVFGKEIVKNRHLLAVFEIIEAFKTHIASIQVQLETFKKAAAIETRNSRIFLGGNIKMAKSIIAKNDNTLNSFIFDDPTLMKSQSTICSTQKRREVVATYAKRQKIQQLLSISESQLPLDQVTRIRSGYGSIKKIECMQYFPNLKQLLLYNNQIKIIEGLSKNIKLNVLSLGYNKIEKIQNIGHLKELKRLKCNKIGRSSAEYMIGQDWKYLQSLTISFHGQTNQENDECLNIMFGSKIQNQWSSLKTLYIYNSKMLVEDTKQLLKDNMSKKKSNIQIYWS